AETGDHYDQRLHRPGLKLFEKLSAFTVWQTDIDDHQVEVVLVQKFLGGGQGIGRSNIVTLVSELLFEVFAYDQVVFQNDNLFYRHRLLDLSFARAPEASIFCRVKR